jgi:hypothetical protein
MHEGLNVPQILGHSARRDGILHAPSIAAMFLLGQIVRKYQASSPRRLAWTGIQTPCFPGTVRPAREKGTCGS